MTNIAICGANGKMGKNIYNCIKDRDDCTVVAGVDIFTQQYADFLIVESPDKLPVKPDVIIDFSNPALLHDLLAYCLSTGTPLVIGSTGYSAIIYNDPVSLEELKPHLEQTVRGIIRNYIVE